MTSKTLSVALLLILGTQSHVIDDDEVPRVQTSITECLECLKSSYNYWCVATETCYRYTGDFGSIAGRDCTRPD